ncbi:hypothetical protein Desde_1093 [Desulfitobacterium dehalogenans ATCC 51507]|uniref:Uncharacterized protein n=1 Tax=Desulfitobacterium dehalogenans (strain ATCC 51507 / DSM 9161 / JW/IU-DC1) TaxID=756499 RepID=I4A6E1_DESDJ|nr:hypothetical protein [Desulfitobacterium dehalogenans]AFL99525.1 hypothetical protein Desde_1093 [Desulfitobacterium dehalogenans ATCC 51507]
MPIFGSRDWYGNLCCNFKYVQGISDFDDNGIFGVRITQEDAEQRLSIALRIGKGKTPKYLFYDQIVSIEIRKKHKTRNRDFFINYHPADNPEDIKVLSFEIVDASLHWRKFVEALKNKIPQPPEPEQLDPQPEPKASQYL